MYVMFLNHASVLIESGGRYLLLDPWFERPAFGSWLPTLPMPIHPAYLTALGNRLSILVSHAHDDHCDDDVLRLFDPQTRVLTAKFASSSSRDRLDRIGFTDVACLPNGEVMREGPFAVTAFFGADEGVNDAVYLIECDDGVFVHCNDNWPVFAPDLAAAVGAATARCGAGSCLLASQINVASAYPFSYRQFGREEKRHRARAVIRKMLEQGLKNAAQAGIGNFLGYAGFSTVFREGVPEVGGFVPTGAWLSRTFAEDRDLRTLMAQVGVLDMGPGDTFESGSGTLVKSIFGKSVCRDVVAAKARQHYEQRGISARCTGPAGRVPAAVLREPLVHFADTLRAYATSGPDAVSLCTKTFEIVIEDINLSIWIAFGDGVRFNVTSIHPPPNKRLYVGSVLMAAVIEGTVPFEHLYTGSLGEWERYPPDVYNRDIVSALLGFSYHWLNALTKDDALCAAATFQRPLIAA